ncbi:hypothetical protein IIF7_18884 [Zunongwangia atlantica 22II14-10F7]|uniref:Uncharacterized protein n=1 Tax=Zunongwangia atlantica 22II14-10F7 TaxID=1185767 RepID=A0A1Y1SZK1_9FLAO|nr:hypothetical protein IIF7_18884 [Zunongwangia atlantica 22II14-10F7]
MRFVVVIIYSSSKLLFKIKQNSVILNSSVLRKAYKAINSLLRGIFLNMVIMGNFRFAVYLFFKFFVEVEYINKENKIIGLKSFVTG